MNHRPHATPKARLGKAGIIICRMLGSGIAVGICYIAGSPGVGAAGAVCAVLWLLRDILLIGREEQFGNFLRGLASPVLRRPHPRGAVPAASACTVTGAGWLAMRIASRLMPPASGRRWLAEAASFLAEAPPTLQRDALSSYLASVPQVIAMSWASVLTRRARPGNPAGQ